MVYSKEDIMFEATYAGDMAKLETATDMIIEHYDYMMEANLLDPEGTADAYFEAEGGIITAVKSFIDKIIAKVRDMYDSVVEKIQESRIKKQLDKISSPEFKKKVSEAMKSGKKYIEEVSIDNLRKLADTVESFVDKACDEISKAAEAVSNCKKKVDQTRAAQKLNKLLESLDDKLDTLIQKFNDATDNKVKIAIDKAVEMAKNGIDYVKESKVFQNKITKKLNELASKMKAVEGEDADASTAENGSAIRNAASKVSSWASKHSKVLKTVAVVSAASAAAVATAVAAGSINAGGDGDDDGSSTTPTTDARRVAHSSAKQGGDDDSSSSSSSSSSGSSKTPTTDARRVAHSSAKQGGDDDSSSSSSSSSSGSSKSVYDKYDRYKSLKNLKSSSESDDDDSSSSSSGTSTVSNVKPLSKSRVSSLVSSTKSSLKAAGKSDAEIARIVRKLESMSDLDKAKEYASNVVSVAEELAADKAKRGIS